MIKFLYPTNLYWILFLIFQEGIPWIQLFVSRSFVENYPEFKLYNIYNNLRQQLILF